MVQFHQAGAGGYARACPGRAPGRRSPWSGIEVLVAAGLALIRPVLAQPGGRGERSGPTGRPGRRVAPVAADSGRQGRAAGLMGRRSERDALDRLAGAVQAGESRALVVRGEPGVGKTVLLDHQSPALASLHRLDQPVQRAAFTEPVDQSCRAAPPPGIHGHRRYPASRSPGGA